MKLIKFDLPINGTKVKNLEELRDNLTDEILTLARSGQLERWLRTRQLAERAQAVADAVKREGSDKGLFLALCQVLEVEAHPDDVKAIFDVAPAPGRFIPGARYFQLYEDLKKSLDQKAEEKIVNSYKVIKIVKVDAEFFGARSWDRIKFAQAGVQVGQIFVEKGANVIEGALIMEVRCGASMERVYSPVRGVVEEISCCPGDWRRIGGKLISIAEMQS